MTWGKPKNGQQQGWGYWQGAWSSWQRDKAANGQQQEKSLLTPYDKIKVDASTPAAETALAVGQVGTGHGDGSSLRDLQSSVNAARKAAA